MAKAKESVVKELSAVEIAEKVVEQDGTLSALHGRQDEDRELVELADYVLKDVNGDDVPNSVSVTLNDSAVFATNVESSLGSSTEQIVVTAEDKGFDTAYVEDFLKWCFKCGDKLLTKSERFPLNPFLDQQMCRRGGGGARILFTMDETTNTLICDISPWDRRFSYFGIGKNGYEWAAYKTKRSKERIIAQYPKAEVEDKDADILDIWTRQNNTVIMNEIDEIYTMPHPWGFVPVCSQIVPMGSMMADADSLEHQGESIFFLIRDLVPELNRLVSIIQSLNQKALDNALLWKSQQGATATPPTYEDLTKPGNVTSADVQGGAFPVDYGEIKRSAYLLHTMIETRIQRGSVSNVDLGIMGNQPWSAVALLQIGEGRDQVFLPRLGARGTLKQSMAEMIIQQCIMLKASKVVVGFPGHQRTFDLRKLVGEYEIQFKYFIKSPKIDAARFTMAASVGNLISDKAKRRDILQREDPEGDEREIRWEEAEYLSPAIKMQRTIVALSELAERGDKNAALEAEILSAEMEVNIGQMMGGDTTQQPTPERKVKPSQLMPAFGGGGGGGSGSGTEQVTGEEQETREKV